MEVRGCHDSKWDWPVWPCGLPSALFLHEFFTFFGVSEQPSFCSRLVLRIQTSDLIRIRHVRFVNPFRSQVHRGPTRSRCLVLRILQSKKPPVTSKHPEMGAIKVVKPLRIQREWPTFLLGNCRPDTVSPSWDVVEYPLNRTIRGVKHGKKQYVALVPQ